MSAKVAGLPSGCVIDGSHMRADDFDLAIIALATGYGFTPEPIGADLTEGDRLDAITWEADRAVDWLGDALAPARTVLVYESCLFVEEVWESA